MSPSVDLEAKKITFTDDTGTNMTAPVLAKAMASLKKVKAGDKVTLTCQDNDKGDHRTSNRSVTPGRPPTPGRAPAAA
ncbi:MAG TPA: hypothetical protein VEO94_08440 [Candidatus Dormibacteraeota bacterium]|nr:hypothetical protein [Candidatus Dormibacteraeota bacterium]